MANRNGMGPKEKGPKTGKGLGDCNPIRRMKKGVDKSQRQGNGKR